MIRLVSLLVIATSCGSSQSAGRCEIDPPPWVRGVATERDDLASALAIGPDGAIYVAGRSAGEIFLRRISARGEVEWTRSARGDDLYEVDPSITVDGAGRVWVAGAYEGELHIGSTTLPSAERGNIFLLRFAPDGELKLARAIASEQPARPNAVAADRNGRIAVTGYFTGELDLGGEPPLRSSGYDGFVAVLSSSLGHVWSAQFHAGGSYSAGTGVAFGRDGSVHVTGIANGGRIGAFTIPQNRDETAFVARFDETGLVLWARALESVGQTTPTAIAVDDEGRSYVAGRFEDSLAVDGTTLHRVGQRDAFAAVLDPDGALLWARSVGGPGWDDATSIAVAEDGAAWIAGSVQGAVRWNDTPMLGSGEADAFVATYARDGEPRWLRLFGSNGTDAARAIAIGPGERVVLAGSVSGPIEGSPYGGASDAFVLSMSDAPPLAQRAPADAPELPWPPPRRRWWDGSLERVSSPEALERARNACADGDLGTVRTLIPSEVGAAARMGNNLGGWPLLVHAVDRGRTDVVRYLLQNGADPEADHPSALAMALERGHADIVALLFESGAHMDRPGLLHAAIENPDLVRVLLSHGADPNERSGSWGQTPLIACARLGDACLPVATLLLDAGASLDIAPEHGYRAPIIAASDGDRALLRLFLDRGLDVNARDSDGTTPMWHAAQGGHTEIVRLLLDAGSDVDVSSQYGNTALMEAARLNRADAVELLLSRGARTDARNQDGQTAETLAVQSSCHDVLRVLERARRR